MNITILRRLPQPLYSACKYGCSPRCLTSLHGQDASYLSCLSAHVSSKPQLGIKHHGVLKNMAVSMCQRFSVNLLHYSRPDITRRMKPTMMDDTDTDDEENNFTNVQNKRKVQGNETLTVFKDKCWNTDLKMTFEDWHKLKEEILTENPHDSRLTAAWETTILRLIFPARNIELADSFMDYIRSTGQSPNLACLSIYIDLCGTVCGKQKQDVIFKTYDEMRKISDLFDSRTLKCLILGFSHTDRWRECFEFIEMVKLMDEPTTAYYSPVVSAAIREGDSSMVKELLDRMGEGGMRPAGYVFQDFVKNIDGSESGLTIKLLMEFLRKYNWLISEKTALLLQEHFEGSKRRKYQTNLTQVNKWGECRSCGSRLRRLELLDSEFEMLQRDMLENVLISDNVYKHSSPAEVESFKQFVQENAPFDVVLDALNIAHSTPTGNHSRKANSLFLKDVVDHFTRFKRQRVLVIGRKHMKLWSPRHMNYIEQWAKTFYTDNCTTDDPFTLYAAIYSGKRCLIVSADHMRDHKFRLGPHMKETFEQWQRTHQITRYFPAERGKIYVEMPVKHDTGPQEDDRGWHVPHEDRRERAVYERPNTWLCVRKGTRKTSTKKTLKEILEAD